MNRRAPGRVMTIGAVLARLRGEFPDLTISKIRFLETEGLVEPARTPSGYRQYTPADVDRLRYILTAQRDQFWPLRVIRDALDALDRGLEPAATDLRPQAPQPQGDPDLPDARTLGRSRDPRVRLTRSELASSVGLSDSTIAELHVHALIHPDEDGHFDEQAQRIAAAAAGLAGYGIEPRHLRPFRTTADREIGLINQAMSGRSPEQILATSAEVAHLCLQLHAALLKAGLAR